MPTARYGLAVASVGGQLYAVGGFDRQDKELATVESSDPASGGWRSVAPVPTARGVLGLAADGNRLVAVGGSSGAGPLAAVEAYDPATDRWTALSALPVVRERLAAAALNGGVYALGGLGSSEVDVLKGASWSTGPAFNK